jgi:hypothetical protein
MALVWLPPAGVLANNVDEAQNNETEAPASVAPDTTKDQSDKDKGNDKDQENGKSYAEETDQEDLAQTPPSPSTAVLIDSFKVSVSDMDNKAVQRATVKITWINGGSAKKITDFKGIATFEDLPATSLNVQVTANRHRSHVQKVKLDSDDNEIAVVLIKRD